MKLLEIFLISICISLSGCVITIPDSDPRPPLMDDSDFSDFEGPVTNYVDEVEEAVFDDWINLLD